MYRVCPGCETSFYSRVPSKVYCGPRCKNRCERRRARSREGVPEAPEELDVHVTMHNPTAEQLLYHAFGYASGVTKKPSVFTGSIPTWTVPNNVIFAQGQDGAWFMDRSAGIELERVVTATAVDVPLSELHPKDNVRAILERVLGVATTRAEASPQVDSTALLEERYAGIPTAQVAEPTPLPAFVPRDADIVPDEVTLPEDETL
jgi:hypothetical protein